MGSIQERTAALRLQEVGRAPGIPSRSHDQNAAATFTETQSSVGQGKPRPRPPPPPKPAVTARPEVNGRSHSATVPVTDDVNGGIGNKPDGALPTMATHTSPRPNLPPRTSTQSSNGPALPPRTPSAQSPALPPRRPSETPSNVSRRPSEFALSRKASQESVSSVATTKSSFSAMSNGASTTSQSERFAIRAPTFDPSALPPLPPKRTQEEKEAARQPLRSTYSSPKIQQRKSSTPSLPARQDQPVPPPRPINSWQAQEQQDVEQSRDSERQILPPPPARPKRSALAMGFGNKNEPTPARPDTVPPLNGHPPPIPTASRPDLSALMASKPKPGIANSSQPAVVQPAIVQPAADVCLLCRDFSAPDTHAARFPRESMPSHDTTWLAHSLCDPFPSLTDKARAIFTWCHHNIAYDVVSFFNRCVQPSTPQSTLASGLAVCEGYAGLYAALALKVGLECVVISGASKGFGHSQLKPGEPLPTYKSTHAWNAVRIDNGEWKLIDACWGAGHLKNQQYVKRFSPERFTQSNSDFGRDHYPGDASKQLRNDGRTLSWEEYVVGNKNGTGAEVYGGYVEEEGIRRGSLSPQANPISLSQIPGPTIRFKFQKICPHYEPRRKGKAGWPTYILHLDGLDGTGDNHMPFNYRDGVWWLDVPVRDLGGPGNAVSINAVTSINDEQLPRGWTNEQYLKAKGRSGMSFGGICKWTTAA